MKRILALILFTLSSIFAQEIFNDFNMQPEVWHFQGTPQGQVDNKGDLNLSIPVMTVPGRGGLDYSINFSYHAPILRDQSATWIGLGWNFDPGSITRDPQGGIENEVGVDFASIPSVLPDMYYLTIPSYGTFPMSRTNNENFVSSFLVINNFMPLNTDSKFYLHEWRPWKIDIATSQNLSVGSLYPYANGWNSTCVEEITGFVVTTDDGTRYVFGMPTFSLYSTYCNLPQQYVSAWRLLAILAPDYNGETLIPDLIDGGKWIKFEYSYGIPYGGTTEAETQHRYSGPSGQPTKLVHLTYLSKIITPTHTAEFITQIRNDVDHTYDGSLNETNFHKKLVEIDLKRNGNSSILEKVSLIQDNHLCPLNEGGTGKTTLNEIRFYGEENASEPGYKFEYEENPLFCNPTYGPLYNRDDFGYYDNGGFTTTYDTDKEDADAWSLTEVYYPTGGMELYEYENDSIYCEIDEIPYQMIDYHGNTPPYFIYDESYSFTDRFRQGGTRVKSIVRSDGMGNNDTTNYTYGIAFAQGGFPTGVPPYYFSRIGDYAYFTPNNRGSLSVIYSNVVENIDGKEKNTYYALPLTGSYIDWEYNPVSLLYVDQYVLGSCLISGNEDLKSGHVEKVSKIAPGNSYQKEINYNSSLYYSISYLYSLGPFSVNLEWYLKFPDYETITENSLETTTEYEYTGDTRQLRKKKIIGSKGEQKTINTTYAYEEYSSMADENILSAVAKKDVLVTESSTNTYYSSQVTKWKEYNSYDTWYPYQEYSWLSSQPSASEPSFTAWDESENPTSEWHLTKVYLDYDDYGNLIQSQDANSQLTNLYYGSNSSPLSQSATFQHAYLTGVEKNDLNMQINYNANGQVYSIQDPNGLKNYFYYDDFGRLSATVNNEGKLQSSNNYYYSRKVSDIYDDENPNYVQAVSTAKGGLYEPCDDIFEWNPIDGSWTVENGEISQDNVSDSNTHLYRSYSQSNSLLVEWDATIESGGGAMSGMHILADNYNHDVGNNYLIWTNASSVRIYYHDTSGLHTLNTTEGYGSVAIDTWSSAHWSVYYTNGTFEIYKDGKRIDAKWVDTTPLTSGSYISLRTNTSHIHFDNIKVINNPIISRSYVDGLAREIQTQQKDGNKTIVVAKEYDEQNRNVRSWKPYQLTDVSFDFAADYRTNALNYYDGNGDEPDCGNYPYRENLYGLNDFVYKSYFEGDLYHLPEDATGDYAEYMNPFNPFRYKNNGFGTNSDYDSLDYVSGTVRRNQTIDENYDYFVTYSDKFGMLVEDRKFQKELGTVLIDYIAYSDPLKVIETKSFYYIPSQTGIIELTWNTTKLGDASGYGELLIGTTEGGSDIYYDQNSNSHEEVINTITFIAGVKYYFRVIAHYDNQLKTLKSENEKFPEDSLVIEGTRTLDLFTSGIWFHLPTCSIGAYEIISKTGYKYDGSGNLTETYTPKYYEVDASEQANWVIYNQYNTLGQLTASCTPDLDGDNDGNPLDERLTAPDVSYKYDDAGNLRFLQNPNHKTSQSNFNYSTLFMEGSTDYNFSTNRRGVFSWYFENMVGEDATMEIYNSQNKLIYSITSDIDEDQIVLSPGSYLLHMVLESGDGVAFSSHFYGFSYIYNKYDEYNRLTETGEYCGTTSFSSANSETTGDPAQDFPTSSKYAHIVYSYDAANGYTGAGNLEGRLAQTTYYFPMLREQAHTYYSYDDDGNVEWIINSVPGLGQKRIDYEYDLLGNVTKIDYNQNEEDQYYFWYEYNNLGQLEYVYSHYADSKPATADAYYTYFANGQVKRLELGGTAQGVDYRYNSRDWLVGLNAENKSINANPNDDGLTGSAFNSDRFKMILGYDDVSSNVANALSGEAQFSGNISWMEWMTYGENNSSLGLKGYVFDYDDLSRMKKADCSTYLSGWSTTDNAFDVDGLNYDIMGNISTLTRKDENGLGNAFTYDYSNGNRLNYVSGYNSQSTGNYSYDGNGNLLKDVSKNINNVKVWYDYRNLPVLVEDNSKNTIQYAYDTNGNRVMKKYIEYGQAAGGNYYIQDKDGRTIAVYDLNGDIKFFNLYGLDMIGNISR